ncbi:hypothetical protein PtA15_10A253 [Puccinia triticina]|uniref:Uncharacterized protein n=1 Tax=Puccinia triticina TaxID=208348 RepID=A0ABY7CV92_9BASI|nr:uncharacterized protein PtA15_10A253 [Puccinia triticina]WAQ88833.1 hypothetical protein PtA15_10A253 [Puccinia triticina]
MANDPRGPSRGIDYTKADVATLVRQLCKSLHRQHLDHRKVVVDFDLLAVFLMQEIAPKTHIRKIVQLLLAQFQLAKFPAEGLSTGAPPRTALQSQLLQAAESVHQTIRRYNESQNAADTKAMAKFWNKITFYSKLSLWINKAFLPQSTKIAEAAIGFLEKHGSDYLRENLKNEKNKIIACK